MNEKIAYVIEDINVTRQRISGMLEKAGYAVTQFASADAALAHMGYDPQTGQVVQNLPTFISTDNDTESRYNGVTVLDAAKKSGVPAIMISGNQAANKEAQTLGFQTWLKPFSDADEAAIINTARAAGDQGLLGKLNIKQSMSGIRPGGQGNG